MVINILEPFMIQSSPSLIARVFILATSEPALDSVTATAVINVQGKTENYNNNINTKSWSENNIHFPLIPPQNIDSNTIPSTCVSWFDGCNTCRVNNGQLGGCTRMMCFREDEPRCLQYATPGH